MRITAEHGLILFGGDTTYAFVPSPAPNDTYLIDDASVDWYKSKFDWHIICIQHGQSCSKYYNYAIHFYIMLGLTTTDYNFFFS